VERPSATKGFSTPVDAFLLYGNYDQAPLPYKSVDIVQHLAVLAGQLCTNS
jgi:hypothetical protein